MLEQIKKVLVDAINVDEELAKLETVQDIMDIVEVKK